MADRVLLAVDEDADALRDIERELTDRYARHYRIVCAESADQARTCLADASAAGDEVAVVLAAQSLGDTSGTELCDEARHLFPHARRGLLVAFMEWGDRELGEKIFDAISHGHIDHYLLRPAAPSDELFHQGISSLLLEWTEARQDSPAKVHIVGEEWSGRAFELREVLGRCAIPHSFCLADSEDGQALVGEAAQGKKLPIVVFPDGTVLEDPSNTELALGAGSPVSPERMEFDLVIVGAGPAGLSAAVYGASEGFSTLVVDEGGIGGQATSSSLIRNYLGFPRGVGGRRLAQQAYEQAWVFGANFAFMQKVTDIRRENGEVALTLSDSGPVRARAVLLATGASYRQIGVPALEELNGAGVFYGGAVSAAPTMGGFDAYVVGGANSAGQAALHLARYAKRVTLVVRAESLDAGMSDYLVREVEATPNLEVRLGTEVVGGEGDGWLERLVLRDRESGDEETVEADALFLMIGARPRTDWLPEEVERDSSGFVLTGADLGVRFDWPLERDPFLLETSLPGVFAAGDARHGSVKRVASAVGEGSIAIQVLHSLFEADELHPRGRPKAPDAVES